MKKADAQKIVLDTFTALLFGACSMNAHADGRAEFMKYGCYQCHGSEGQGTLVGPRIAPNPWPVEALSAFVRGSSRAMPPYSTAVLPEADLVKIHEYLKSRPPAVDTKNLLGP